LEAYKEIGEDIVDWVEEGSKMDEIQARISSFRESLHDLEDLSSAELDEKADSMEKLHDEFLLKEKLYSKSKLYVQHAQEAFRYAEEKQIEMGAKCKFKQQLHFLAMKIKAKKIVDIAKPILEKEATFGLKKPPATASLPSQATIGSPTSAGCGPPDHTVSPLSTGGVSSIPSEHVPLRLHQGTSPTSRQQSADMVGGSANNVAGGDPQQSIIDVDQEDSVINVDNDDAVLAHEAFPKAPEHESCRKRKLRVNKSASSSSNKKACTLSKKKKAMVVTPQMFKRSERTGFKVNGELTRPSEQGYQYSAGTVFCGPCGTAVLWDARQKHTLSTKHLANIGQWKELKVAEQLKLTQHKEWQEVNNLQGQTISDHCRAFRLDAMRSACQANITTGALVAQQKFLHKYTGHELGGERGLTDNIPFLW
jgi:hypothetical protein